MHSGERIRTARERLPGRHRVNHVLHLILSLVTLGAWLIVWLALVLFAGEKRRLMSVDEYGNLTVQKV